MTATNANFADLLDPRFNRIYNETYKDLPDYRSRYYDVQRAKLYTERVSSVGTFGDVSQFTGSVSYDDVYQGYDTTITPVEFSKGFQIERRLFETDQFSVMDGKPKGLARAMNRRYQIDSTRVFNNAFAVDNFFYTNSENVALCSNSHTTTSGDTTASGFDNLVTTSLSATSLAAARIQMVGYRGDRAEKISVMPDLLVVPPGLYETAYEIVGSKGKVDTANNNANVHYGQYEVIEEIYLSDTNNWFLIDSGLMKSEGFVWMGAVDPEFAFVEDFDSLIGKWRVYCVHANAWVNWRHILGASVS